MQSNTEEARRKRTQEINQEIAQHRAEIETSQKALDKMRDDPDMLADADVRERGRINNAQEAITRLEGELRSLQRP
jgi:uncharacterized coiled-coil DUF342 family protein